MYDSCYVSLELHCPINLELMCRAFPPYVLSLLGDGNYFIVSSDLFTQMALVIIINVNKFHIPYFSI